MPVCEDDVPVVGSMFAPPELYVTMLCLDCEDSQVWVSEVGTVKFGFEIAKANLTGKRPNVGDQAKLNLA